MSIGRLCGRVGLALKERFDHADDPFLSLLLATFVGEVGEGSFLFRVFSLPTFDNRITLSRARTDTPLVLPHTQCLPFPFV